MAGINGNAYSLLTKLEKAHDRACKNLDKFHRYSPGTNTGGKAWDAHCRAQEEFESTLLALRNMVASSAKGEQRG